VVPLAQLVKTPVTFTLSVCVGLIVFVLISVIAGTPAITVKVAVTTFEPVVRVTLRDPRAATLSIVIATDALVGPFTVNVPVVMSAPKLTVVPAPKLVPLPVITMVSVDPWCAEPGLSTAPGPAAVTVRLMVVVWVKLPEVPVMVTVVGPPVVAEPLAVSVSTLVLPVIAGLNDAVTPLGRPDVTARLTFPANPFVGFTVIVLVPLLPCAMLKLLGAADSV
jgi:hypothetical protein